MVQPNAQGCRRAIWNPDPAVEAGERATVLSRGFHFSFSVEVGDDVLEGRDGLLNRGDLHQFPATDRTIAILQRDNQIAPLLLELNKR